MTDISELLSRARAGDQQAFAEIYDSFAQKIFKFISLKIQNRQEAEDVLQDVFIKAYKGLPSLNMARLNFSAWLYKVAGNTINDYFRSKYRKPEPLGIDENFDAADRRSLAKEISAKWDWQIVQTAFNELPVLYKQVLELRFIQNFSPEETARILGKTNLSIRLIQFRALKKLKLMLDGYDIKY